MQVPEAFSQAPSALPNRSENQVIGQTTLLIVEEPYTIKRDFLAPAETLKQ
jgi:hypothetical protein